MTAAMIATACLSTALLFIGFVIGYLVGSKVGIDSAVPHALRMADLVEGDVPDNALTQYLRDQFDKAADGLPRKSSVKQRLAADEEYQRQLREQAANNG